VNTPVNIFPCNGGSNQLWLVVSDGHGQPTIRPLNADPTTGTRNCLDVTNGVYNGQAGLQLFTCLNQTNQEWKFGTWLHTDNESSGWFGWSCDGVVAFATATGTRWIGQGEVGAFRTDGYSGQVPELCSDGAFNQHTTDCPAATNWMVVDRRPGNDVTVACFQQ